MPIESKPRSMNPSRARISLIASDVDGTLVHRVSGGSVESDLVNVDSRGSRIHRDALKELTRIRDAGIPLLLITSRRVQSASEVSKILNPQVAIVEDGCVILDHGEPLQPWLDYLGDAIGPVDPIALRAAEEGPLWECFEKARSAGFQCERDGFLASFKVVLPAEGRDEAIADPEGYLRRNGVNLNERLKCSPNWREGSMLVIPRRAGKRNALAWLAEQRGYDLSTIVGLGDDLNDLEFLQLVGFPATHRGARNEVLEVVQQREGIVASGDGHLGTIAMLQAVRHLRDRVGQAYRIP